MCVFATLCVKRERERRAETVRLRLGEGGPRRGQSYINAHSLAASNREPTQLRTLSREGGRIVVTRPGS